MSNETQESEIMKLEKYKILYQAYADEIKNLWQRSIFLGAFMVLVWTGYGVSLLKFLETTKENKLCQNTCTNIEFLKSLCEFLTSLNVYHFILLALCGIIIILSLLWIAMAKGSKFVQEAHERHIKTILKKSENKDIKSLFCDLNDKEKILDKKLCRDLFFCGTLKAYRYSPSKINIALGWVSYLVALALILIHSILIIFFSNKSTCSHIIIIVLIDIVIIIIPYLVIPYCLKGGQNKKTKPKNQNENQISKQGA